MANGLMSVNNEKYKYKFKTEDGKVVLNFYSKNVEDATYSYSINESNNTLTLIGEEGTAGGEYTLNREK